MTLTLRPVGRGNWATLTIHIHGERASPIMIACEDRLAIGGITYRVVSVAP